MRPRLSACFRILVQALGLKLFEDFKEPYDTPHHYRQSEKAVRVREQNSRRARISREHSSDGSNDSSRCKFLIHLSFASENVDDFVAVKAHEFNRDQQNSASRPQQVQQSLGINRILQISIRSGIWFGTRGRRFKSSLPDQLILGSIMIWDAQRQKHCRRYFEAQPPARHNSSLSRGESREAITARCPHSLSSHVFGSDLSTLARAERRPREARLYDNAIGSIWMPSEYPPSGRAPQSLRFG